MNKDVYKKALDDINAPEELISKTYERMRGKNRSVYLRPATALALLLPLVIFSLFLIKPQASNKKPSAKDIYDSAYMNPADSKAPNPLLNQIAENYVPFSASQFSDPKCLSPYSPRSFEELEGSSSIIILCTLEASGVYRDKTESYNPKASFGTYIYTVRIDKILKGNPGEKPGDLIAIKEKAFAHPDYKKGSHEIEKWNFYPYTARAMEAGILNPQKQYVMFLQGKDETSLYTLTPSGFGIFPLEYIESLPKTTSPSQLEKGLKKVKGVILEPLKDDILYKLCAMHVKEEFLNISGEAK